MRNSHAEGKNSGLVGLSWRTCVVHVLTNNNACHTHFTMWVRLAKNTAFNVTIQSDWCTRATHVFYAIKCNQKKKKSLVGWYHQTIT